MLHQLIALHLWLRRWPLALRVVWMTRLLLAMGFLPTGLVKVLGQRFTTMPLDTTVGFFFEAMYRTGFYWNFIGGMQILASLLLLIPATSLLGAVLFFPIILNIHMITSSVGFVGTPILTAMMLLASVYLLLWDAHRLTPLLHPRAHVWSAPESNLPIDRTEGLCYAAAFGCGMVVMAATRGFVSGATMPTMLLGSLLSGLAGVAWWLWRTKALRTNRP